MTTLLNCAPVSKERSTGLNVATCPPAKEGSVGFFFIILLFFLPQSSVALRNHVFYLSMAQQSNLFLPY